MPRPDYILTAEQRQTLREYIAAIDTLLPQHPANGCRLRELRGKLVRQRRLNARDLFASFWHQWEAAYRFEVASGLRLIAIAERMQAERAAA